MSEEAVSTEETRNEIVEKLLKEHPILDLVSFNEFNLSEKLSKNPMLYMKYRDLAAAAKHDMELMELLFEKVRGEQYDYYRFNIDANLTKSEIEQYYLPKDAKLLKIKKIMLIQKIKVEFFESCAKSLDKQTWAMRNWIEESKLM